MNFCTVFGPSNVWLGVSLGLALNTDIVANHKCVTMWKYNIYCKWFYWGLSSIEISLNQTDQSLNYKLLIQILFVHNYFIKKRSKVQTDRIKHFQSFWPGLTYLLAPLQLVVVLVYIDVVLGAMAEQGQHIEDIVRPLASLHALGQRPKV